MKIHKEGATTILMALVFAVLLGGTSRYFGAPPVLYWILFSIPMGLAVFSSSGNLSAHPRVTAGKSQLLPTARW